MPYTKPYTYVDGTTINNTEQNSNDDSARFSVNQQTESTDISPDSFDFDSIERGELNPINNSHQFTTGEVYGQSNNNSVLNRSYFTSETKANSQVGNTSVQYQTIFETGDRFEMERAGTVFITFGGTFISEENISASAPPYNDGSHPGQGKWDSKVILEFVDESNNSVTRIAGTRGFSFEETGSASAGALDPGGSNKIARRWIGFEWMIDIATPGFYQLRLAINPKVEKGFAGPRSYTIEIFYT